MTTELDLSPAAGAARPARRVVAHGLTEARLLARNGEQLLLALVIPLALLLIGDAVGTRFASLAQLPASVLALAVWSSAFTSIAIATGFERRYGVLERLAVTPLGRRGLLLGKTMAVGAMILGQLIILVAVGLALGWRPVGGVLPTVIMLGSGILAVTTFVALALLLAGTIRAEATLALANLIYLIMVVIGAVVVPVATYPGWARPIVRLLPTAAWAEALRDWSAGIAAWWPLPVLAVWAIVTVLVTTRLFRWTS